MQLIKFLQVAGLLSFLTVSNASQRGGHGVRELLHELDLSDEGSGYSTHLSDEEYMPPPPPTRPMRPQGDPRAAGMRGPAPQYAGSPRRPSQAGAPPRPSGVGDLRPSGPRPRPDLPMDFDEDSDEGFEEGLEEESEEDEAPLMPARRPPPQLVSQQRPQGPQGPRPSMRSSPAHPMAAPMGGSQIRRPPMVSEERPPPRLQKEEIMMDDTPIPARKPRPQGMECASPRLTRIKEGPPGVASPRRSKPQGAHGESLRASRGIEGLEDEAPRGKPMPPNDDHQRPPGSFLPEDVQDAMPLRRPRPQDEQVSASPRSRREGPPSEDITRRPMPPGPKAGGINPKSRPDDSSMDIPAKRPVPKGEEAIMSPKIHRERVPTEALPRRPMPSAYEEDGPIPRPPRRQAPFNEASFDMPPSDKSRRPAMPQGMEMPGIPSDMPPSMMKPKASPRRGLKASPQRAPPEDSPVDVAEQEVKINTETAIVPVIEAGSSGPWYGNYGKSVKSKLGRQLSKINDLAVVVADKREKRVQLEELKRPLKRHTALMRRCKNYFDIVAYLKLAALKIAVETARLGYPLIPYEDCSVNINIGKTNPYMFSSTKYFEAVKALFVYQESIERLINQLDNHMGKLQETAKLKRYNLMATGCIVEANAVRAELDKALTWFSDHPQDEWTVDPTTFQVNKTPQEMKSDSEKYEALVKVVEKASQKMHDMAHDYNRLD